MPDSLRILFVEDDPEQSLLFTIILSNDGNEVITRPDAKSALEYLKESTVALLLTDWNLPGMMGDKLIATAKAQYPAIKTILYSNHAHVDEAATICGADGWFRKMDNSANLRQMIAKLLREGDESQESSDIQQ